MARLLRLLSLAWGLSSVLLVGTTHAATSLQVCRDWTGQGVGCTERVPQGAPWIVVVGQDLPKGRLSLVVTGPDGHVYGARLLLYAMAMNDHDYPLAVEAAQALVDVRRATAGQIVQPIDYLNLINALIGACRIDRARAVLVEALGEYPNVPAFTSLAGEIDKARQKCP